MISFRKFNHFMLNTAAIIGYRVFCSFLKGSEQLLLNKGNNIIVEINKTDFIVYYNK